MIASSSEVTQCTVGSFGNTVTALGLWAKVASTRLNSSFPAADADLMFDELDRLRTNPHLLDLLGHYAHLGAENRETWQGRLMHLEGVEPTALVKLHGELLAFGWVDLNTGQVPICYRITLAGLRAMRQAKAEENVAEDLPAGNKAA